MVSPPLVLGIAVFAMASVGEGSSENDLVCYQCQSHSMEECGKAKYLKPCPNDQAYNRCETVIKKNGPTKNTTVSKKCSLAPCQLEGDVLGMEKSCDQSRDSFFCSFCCRENGCNGGTGLTAVPALSPALLLGAVLVVNAVLNHGGADAVVLASSRRRSAVGDSGG